MNDPLFVTKELSDNQSNEALEASETNSADDIARFFQDINKRHSKLSDEDVTKGTPEKLTIDIPPYTADYKPITSNNKKYTYSINELISYSKDLSSAGVEDLINSLPKKKFWRLSRRYSDHTSHSKNVGNKVGTRNSSTNSNSKPILGEEALYERRNSKSKGSKSSHPKRANKFTKSERAGYMEEKDITVNNDDLLALEEEFQPTGNSMADFESWKAKMKEMERRKKGLINNSRDDPLDPKIALSTNSSSISDFLKLNTKNHEIDGSVASDSPVKVTKKTIEEDKLDYPAESLKGSSSRFSSFFTHSSSSVSSSPGKNAVSERASIKTNKSIESNPNIAGGSRLLSFFNNDSQKSKEASTTLSSSRTEQPNLMVPQPFPQQGQQQGHLQGRHPIHSGRPLTSPQSIPTQLPQTNNAFFQGLLNKGKVNEPGRNPGPPPGMAIAPGRSQIPQQRQQANIQTGMNVPQGFPMVMPPSGYPPQFQGRPSHLTNGPHIINENPNEERSNHSNSGKKVSRQPQPPIPSGMVPHPFVPGMAPPGFPTMQSMPPNFNPNMYVPSNGMMPPPTGQGFFSGIPPPPSVNMNFSPFPVQHGMPTQQENRKK